MGQDKRFLRLDGIALIDRCLKVLETLFPEVMVVLAEPIPQWTAGRHRVAYDEIENCGSLGGLYTGLMRASTPRVFAVACDMPFLNADLIRHLCHLDSDADIICARLTTGLEPMHAVYSKRCVPLLEKMARSGHLKIRDLFDHPGLRLTAVGEPDLVRLDPDLGSFRNINTPAEYAAAQSILPQRHRS
jgi:molybdopterin-guanine dinucleotide biosynthesis protein A